MSTLVSAPFRRGLFFVSVAAVAWGSGGIVAAVLYRTSGLGPVAVSFWRLLAGIAVLLAFHQSRRRRGTVPPAAAPRRWWIYGVTGVGLAVYQAAHYAAIAEAGVAVATVITLGAAPVMIAVGARFTLAERLGVRGVITVVVALAGLVLLVGDSEPAAAGTSTVLGVVYSLLSASGYAAVTLLTRAVGGAGDPLGTVLIGFLIATACLLPLAYAEGLVPSADGLAGTLAMLLYLGVVPTALAYLLYFAGLAVVPATTASIVVLLEPVTAAAIAVTALGEPVTAGAVAGTCLLLGSVAALTTGARRSGGGRRLRTGR